MLAFVAIATMISSCKKDDKGNDSTALEGVWQLESMTVNGTPEGLDDCDKKSTLTFTATTFTSLEIWAADSGCGSATSRAAYTVSEDKIILKYEDKTVEIGYSISGNQLTVSEKRNNGDIVVTVYVKK